MRPHNLLVIMSDEHDARHMGASGSSIVHTPHLDRLAARSRHFVNAYTPSPICVPARAAFATGRHIHDIGYWDNALPYDGRISSWGHVLQRAGRRVEAIGKLHYSGIEAPTGFDRQHNPMHVTHGQGMVWGSIRDPLPELPFTHLRMLGDVIGAGESSYTRYDRDITTRAINWLDTAAKQPLSEPWVLYVGFVAPHFPLIAPEEFCRLYPLDKIPPIKSRPDGKVRRHPWVEAYDAHYPHDRSFVDAEERTRALATYFALCSFLDHNIGQILDALDRNSLIETTRIVYASDHGDNLGARGLWGKSTLYQESTHIPLMIAGPDDTPERIETPVTLLDLFPTILESVGVSDPEAASRPGRSLLSLSPADESRVAFSQYHAVGATSGAYMIRKGAWKYHYYVGFEPELFNLEDDPEELTDRARDPNCLPVLAELHQELLAICDPVVVDLAAKHAQSVLIERFGGREKALHFGARGATPPPKQTYPA